MSAPAPAPTTPPQSSPLEPLLVDMDPIRLAVCNMALSLKNSELRRDIALLRRRLREMEDANRKTQA